MPTGRDAKETASGRAEIEEALVLPRAARLCVED